ncbi:copper homeostasis protein CutC [Adhaeribacter rhizoryzae]|uniref:copper homeostasis protein CutC n=1 Tax=Adhaeribacter rhizoryzae TaxID=2607907 RepID=UPI001CC21914|nr:copper homeostasis protein CutC [Adhaeribacter rhizoryzae]
MLINAEKSVVKLEICTDSVISSVTAQEAGATRVELCAGLFEGGLTPSAGLISLTRQQITIGLHVLIRPRGGDFCYSEEEFEIMLRDIALAKEMGCDGVVIGILNLDGTIDVARTNALIAAAQPMSVTFHRAFDMTPEPFVALNELIQMGVARVLTSGQERTVLEGSELIAQLVQAANNQIIIMPGGGITERNIARIRRETNAPEFHLSARKKMPGNMQYRNERVSMGGELRLPEFELAVADTEKITSALNAVNIK